MQSFWRRENIERLVGAYPSVRPAVRQARPALRLSPIDTGRGESDRAEESQGEADTWVDSCDTGFVPGAVRCAIVAGLVLVGSVAFAQDRVQLDSSASDPRVPPPGTKAAAIVWVFTSTDCPVSNRYAPEVRRLAARFGPEGVVFRLIYPNPRETPRSILEHMTAFAYAGATQAFHDPAQALVRLAGVTVTPEAAVYAGGRVVYRGRIDDRYVDLGRERPAPTVHDLADALTAVLSGRPVLSPVTQAVGCFIADFTR